MNAGDHDVQAPSGAAAVAADCRGSDFFALDEDFRALLGLYLPDELRTHLWPHFERLGALAGGHLDTLAQLADRHPPVLHPRDRFGRDREWIEYHPSYHDMERIAYGELGLHAMSHRAGVLGWPAPLPPVAKYAFQYLFVQAEFGLMCPVSVSDTSAFMLNRYGDPALKERFLPRMLSQDMDRLLRGTQFMTERAGGSDVGLLETRAVHEGGVWRLYGDKWFCSHADADVAMILARPDGAAAGTRGLGLFLLPRHLDSGERNRYRIVRLKDKLGTRSMASGEIRLDGAEVYPVGDVSRGLRQMMDQVSLSRLSHGVRAAAMMRRCWNEARVAAATRFAFGGAVIQRPLARRQLVKLRLPTEQALSMFLFTAEVMGAAQSKTDGADALLRILTPLLKLRACRDNVRVATGAMEMRGGNGYIEDWVHARLVRDAQVGLLWEGTSNIVALDAIQRAVAKVGAHAVLRAELGERMARAGVAPSRRDRIEAALDGAIALAVRVGGDAALEVHARHAARVLYDATSAAVMAVEGARLALASGGPPGGAGDRRSQWADLVVSERLSIRDPLSLPPGEHDVPDALLA